MYVQCTCNANITRFCDIFLLVKEILVKEILYLIAILFNTIQLK